MTLKANAKRRSQSKVRHHGHADLTNVWVVRPPRIVRSGITRHAGVRARPPLSEHQAAILALLGSEPQREVRLAEQLGISRGQAASALYGLSLRKLANRSPNGHGWTRA